MDSIPSFLKSELLSPWYKCLLLIGITDNKSHIKCNNSHFDLCKSATEANSFIQQLGILINKIDISSKT